MHPPTLFLDGVMIDNGKPVVCKDMTAEARRSVETLRANARDADEQAAYCNHKRRRSLERAARDARSLADAIEKQCDRIEKGES